MSPKIDISMGWNFLSQSRPHKDRFQLLISNESPFVAYLQKKQYNINSGKPIKILHSWMNINQLDEFSKYILFKKVGTFNNWINSCGDDLNWPLALSLEFIPN